jgi:hypothetical protein
MGEAMVIKTLYTPERRKRITTWRCIGCKRIYKRALPAREIDRQGAHHYVRPGACRACCKAARAEWGKTA